MTKRGQRRKWCLPTSQNTRKGRLVKQKSWGWKKVVSSLCWKEQKEMKRGCFRSRATSTEKKGSCVTEIMALKKRVSSSASRVGIFAGVILEFYWNSCHSFEATGGPRSLLSSTNILLKWSKKIPKSLARVANCGFRRENSHFLKWDALLNLKGN